MPKNRINTKKITFCIGKLEFFENEIYSYGDADSTIGNKKSKLLRYIRNYILSGVSDGYSFNNPPASTFIVSWSPETYWDELLPKLTSAMKDCTNLTICYGWYAIKKKLLKSTD